MFRISSYKKAIIPGVLYKMPGLLLIFILQSSFAMSSPAIAHTADSFPAHPPQLTAARMQENPDHYTISFFQSARFYRLLKSNPQATSCLALLMQSQKKGIAVNVFLTELHGDVIANVTLPGKRTSAKGRRPSGKPPKGQQ